MTGKNQALAEVNALLREKVTSLEETKNVNKQNLDQEQAGKYATYAKKLMGREHNPYLNDNQAGNSMQSLLLPTENRNIADAKQFSGISVDLTKEKHNLNCQIEKEVNKNNPQFSSGRVDANEQENGKQHSARNWRAFLKRKKALRKTGTNEGTGDFAGDIVSSQKKIWLFLSGVNSTTTEEIVINHIVKQLNITQMSDVQVKLCKPKNEKVLTKSFMVGVKPDFNDAVYSETFWPQGVKYERFDFALGRNFLDKSKKDQLTTVAAPYLRMYLINPLRKNAQVINLVTSHIGYSTLMCGALIIKY